MHKASHTARPSRHSRPRQWWKPAGEYENHFDIERIQGLFLNTLPGGKTYIIAKKKCGWRSIFTNRLLEAF